jgi:hypothetical protein
LSKSSFRNPSRREVPSSPALRDLTLFARNDEDAPEIARAAPAGALDGEPINTLCATALAANSLSSKLVVQANYERRHRS